MNQSNQAVPVAFSVGTNIGSRQQNLELAVRALTQRVEISMISAVYETDPWGPIQDQPDFYNICLIGTTRLSPDDLLRFVKRIENEIGRTPTDRWGPRLIDIDILTYADLVSKSDSLGIPHAEIERRAFVLVPLAEIAPDLIHPVLQRSTTAMLAELGEGARAEVREIGLRLTPALTNRLPRPPLPVAWGARTYVMGILNVTPNSFSGDGIADQIEKDGKQDEVEPVARAVQQAIDFVRAGADIIDIGGESTRPGFEPVTAAEEQARVLPVISAVRAALPYTVISIDSYRAETARLALATGADWINDVWGLQYDPAMKTVAAEQQAPLIIMHNGRNRAKEKGDDGAGGYYGRYTYADLIGEVVDELRAAATEAAAAGLPSTSIVLDPGVGFGKTAPQSMALINHLDRIKGLGYPVLLGSSRKGFVGAALGGLPAAERIEGTAATVALGILRGADIVRVHDVKEMARVARMIDQLLAAD